MESLQWDFGDGSGDIGETVTHTFDTPGTYTVTLTASNEAGSTTASTEVSVLLGVDPPEAVIGTIPAVIVDGQFVRLRSESLNDPTRLTWDLGDGTTAAGDAVRHRWTEPGTYRVRLDVSNSAGSDSAFVDVRVDRRVSPPVSQFTQDATEVLVGQNVSFTSLSLNEPNALVWSFDDGTTARGRTASKSWSEPGQYRVRLQAINDAGDDFSGEWITVVQPIDPPAAAFAAPAIVATGQAVSFRDTSANNPSSWSWSFGDGAAATTASPTHVYAEPGTYEVTLRATNEGGSSTASQQVVVKNPPTANFRFVVDGLTVDFTDTSWDDPQQWQWNFGDGNTSTDRSPEHTFARGGTYTVRLIASNEAGASPPRTMEVVLSEPPEAVIECAVVGRTLECDGSGSANAVSYRWVSEEAVINRSPRQPQTTFAYDSNGRPDITLTVESASGETDTTTIRGPRVLRGLAAEIDDISITQNGNLIRFDAEFSNDPTEWEWELDDAELVQGGAGSFAVFRVNEDGRFRGEVTATNIFGDDTDPLRVTVQDFAPEASFTTTIIRPGVLEFTNTSTASNTATAAWTAAGNEEIRVRNNNRLRVQYPDEGGTFRVRLTIDDGELGTDVTTEDVTVEPVAPPEPEPEPVEASFTFDVVRPGVLDFVNTSTASGDAQVRWQIIGEDAILVRTADRLRVRFPDEGGTFEARLWIDDGDNGEDMISRQVTVDPVE